MALCGYLFDMSSTSGGGLQARGGSARQRCAELADEVASLAEDFADILERAAPRGDTERRLRTAQVEREIARVERRNAARLRAGHDHGVIGLEHLPRLPVPPGDQV